MLSFVLRRILTATAVLFGVATLVFAVLRLVPGDPVESILGDQAATKDIETLRACFHLDEGLASQYASFWGDVASGSLGELCNQPGVHVSDELFEVLPATLELAFAAIFIALLIALPLGMLSAAKPYSWIDHTSMFFAMLGLSIPNFWLGPMLLILFALSLQWLPDPSAGTFGLLSLLLPAFTLGTALAAKLTRMTRSSMLEVQGRDYVRTARAKGASPMRVTFKHVLRNAATPVVTLIGMQLGAVLTGAIIVEKVFARPGLGSLLIDAIEMRNYQLVQGCVLLIAFIHVTVNLLTDLSYGILDPRVRIQG